MFVAGKQADFAWLLVEGRLRYSQEPDSSLVSFQTDRELDAGTWLSEGALWCSWIHVGTAVAVLHCKLLRVHGGRLIECLKHHRPIREIMCEYAKVFYQSLVTAGPPSSPWPNDVEVPSTEFGVIATSLGEVTQLQISEAALHHWTPRGIFGIAGGKGKVVSNNLAREVEEGISIAVLAGSGELERIISVVAMRIMNQDGLVFAQLGKVVRGKVFCDCRLPAVKRLRTEDTAEAGRRLLNTKLAPLAHQTKVLSVERLTTIQESTDNNIRTRYVVKVLSASFSGEVDALVCDAHPPEAHSVPEDLDELRHQSVFFISYGDKGVLCAWLRMERFERLEGKLGLPVLHKWLACVKLPIPQNGAVSHRSRSSSILSRGTSLLPSNEHSAHVSVTVSERTDLSSREARDLVPNCRVASSECALVAPSSHQTVGPIVSYDYLSGPHPGMGSSTPQDVEDERDLLSL